MNKDTISSLRVLAASMLVSLTLVLGGCSADTMIGPDTPEPQMQSAEGAQADADGRGGTTHREADHNTSKE